MLLMRARQLVSVIATVFSLTCMGNREVPEWQAFGNRSLSSVVQCTSNALSRFGVVKRKVGDQAEAGRVRLLLHQPSGAPSAIVTAYIDGDARFASIWMNATDRRIAKAAWAVIKRRCGVS
jgi:hypothetical protein